jgi:hypothetical protein
MVSYMPFFVRNSFAEAKTFRILSLGTYSLKSFTMAQFLPLAHRTGR